MFSTDARSDATTGAFVPIPTCTSSVRLHELVPAAVATPGDDPDVPLFFGVAPPCRLRVAEKRCGDFQAVAVAENRVGTGALREH